MYTAPRWQGGDNAVQNDLYWRERLRKQVFLCVRVPCGDATAKALVTIDLPAFLGKMLLQGSMMSLLLRKRQMRCRHASARTRRMARRRWQSQEQATKVHALALTIRAHFGPVCDSVSLSRPPTSPPSRTLDGAAASRKASESHGHAVRQPVGAEPRLEPRGLGPESQSIRARLASVWLPRVTGRTPPAGRGSHVWFVRCSTHSAQILHQYDTEICKPVTTATWNHHFQGLCQGTRHRGCRKIRRRAHISKERL